MLIIYHSQSGNTEVMAKAVCEGAISAGANVVLKKAAEATSDDILNCDGVIFGTPNYFSYMAGMIKDFLDRVFYTIRDKVDNKPYAEFSSAGAGGKQALDSIDWICKSYKGLKMKKVFDNVITIRKPSPEVLEECRELGRKMAHL